MNEKYSRMWSVLRNKPRRLMDVTRRPRSDVAKRMAELEERLACRRGWCPDRPAGGGGK